MSEGAGSQIAINFPSPDSAGEREAVQQSLTTMRERIDHLNSVRWSADEALAEVARLQSPADRVKVEIPEDDPAVTAAKDAVALEQREFLAAMALAWSGPAIDEFRVPDDQSPQGPLPVYALPFHYDWHWATGATVWENSSDRSTGQIKVNASADGRCDVHAGVGVSVQADRDQWMTARSSRSSAETCRVKSGGSGEVSLCEGGMEMTVLEGPTLLGVAEDKRFRIRLNPGFFGDPESASHDSGGFGFGTPIEVRWFMRAGHSYQINTGAWIRAEVPGPGFFVPWFAMGTIVANVFAITLAPS